MKMLKCKRLRVDKRTKIRFGRYRYGNTNYFRIWRWGFYLE